MAMDLQTLHTDGANFYQYLRGNPFMGSDPLGLSSDPFDMVDDFITTSASERAAFLSNVGNGMKSAAIMAATIASFLPIPGANIAGELALYALGEQDWQTTAINIGTGFIPGAAMLGKLAKIRHGAVDIAMKSGHGLRGGRGDGIQRAVQQRVDRKRAIPGACGCFTAATLIFTQHGMVPISQIELGDVVIAQNDAGELVLGEVTDLIETQGAALVLVTVEHGSGELETVETTDEHPFYVECPVNLGDRPGFVRADRLQPGDRLRTVTGTALVAAIQFSQRRETVYNFTVGEYHTYHVGANGVLVHNCDLVDALGRGVVDKSHHNWERMFGRKPELHEVRDIIMDTARTGVPDGVIDTTHRDGYLQRYTKQRGPHLIWADVFLDEATNTLRVKNGGIR
jgi:hypothetical protein